MATNLFPDQIPEDILLTPRRDRVIRISISRNTLIALLCSLIIHGLILLTVVPKIEFSPPQSAPTTIEVSLAPPKQPEPIVEPTPEPPLEPVKEPVQKPKVPKVMTQKPKPNAPPPAFKVPDVMDTPKPAPQQLPQPETTYPDMQSYMKAQQAKRQGADWDAARQNAEAVAKENGPSEDEKRNQRISKNLKGGAGGTFTLTSMSGRRATISFNGWVDNLSNQKKQFFEVEAKQGQNLKLLIVKRVISFIRESYQGDFPWESQRLGKEITLSARLDDNSGLEDFLMNEFFGSNNNS
ncbi:MAG: hypothetical protein H0W85_04135 [Methylotenera sp.]|nr:hypothetical protein [Methylotenera sp.]